MGQFGHPQHVFAANFQCSSLWAWPLNRVESGTRPLFVCNKLDAFSFARARRVGKRQQTVPTRPGRQRKREGAPRRQRRVPRDNLPANFSFPLKTIPRRWSLSVVAMGKMDCKGVVGVVLEASGDTEAHQDFYTEFILQRCNRPTREGPLTMSSPVRGLCSCIHARSWCPSSM